MRSLWNPNRFLRSIRQWYWGNPQPGKVFKRRMQARCFTSTNAARRKVHKHRIYLPRSAP
jgi:hypothetical protein